MPTLVETAVGQLPDDFVQQVATSLGIDAGKVRPAATAAAAAQLDAMVRLGATEQGASQIIMALPTSGDDPASFLRAGGIPNLGNLGAVATGALLGSRRDGVVSCVATSAGIPAGAASSILDFVAPLVLGGLNKEIRSRNLNAGSLSSFLRGQQDTIQQAMPAGLSDCLNRPATGTAAAATAVGTYAATGPEPTEPAKVSTSAEPAPPAPPPPPSQPSIWRWLLPLLSILVLGALFLAFLRSGGNTGAVPTPSSLPTTATPTEVSTEIQTVIPTESPAEVPTEIPTVAATEAVAPAIEVTLTLAATSGVTATVAPAAEATPALEATPGVTATVAVDAAVAAGLCQNVSDIEQAWDGLGEITASTQITVVRQALTTGSPIFTQLIDGVAAAGIGIDTAPLRRAYGVVETAVNTLTGDTLGATAAATLNEGLTRFRELQTGVKTTLNCP
jgi:hypothetical protein